MPGTTLTFTSFSSAATEAAYSRVWGGIHFTFSETAALTLGTEIGNWALGAFNSGADTTPPKVTLNTTSTVLTNTDPTVTGIVSSSFGVTALDVQVNNGPLVNVPVNADGSFSYTVPVATDGSADGADIATFTAVDPAGNVSSPVSYSFNLITHAPTITLAADSVTNARTIGAGALLDGTIGLEAGDTLNTFTYAFDNGTPNSVAVTPIRARSMRRWTDDTDARSARTDTDRGRQRGQQDHQVSGGQLCLAAVDADQRHAHAVQRRRRSDVPAQHHVLAGGQSVDVEQHGFLRHGFHRRGAARHGSTVHRRHRRVAPADRHLAWIVRGHGERHWPGHQSRR